MSKTPTTNWTKKAFFGTRKEDDTRIYLSAPTWDCGWYWGFGYLGNKNEHYHLLDYSNGRNINMYDALTTDYDLNPNIFNNVWEFCELSVTAYRLREAAEIYQRGGSHYTINPCASVIKNLDEYTRINWVVLPAIFDKLHDLIFPVEQDTKEKSKEGGEE